MAEPRTFLTFLAEVGSPHEDSPAYDSRPVVAQTLDAAKRQAQEWAIRILGKLDHPHHLRLVQDDETVWVQSYGLAA